MILLMLMISLAADENTVKKLSHMAKKIILNEKFYIFLLRKYVAFDS
jgi:hypothetical protein